jgi:uncharacterized membrane protein
MLVVRYVALAALVVWLGGMVMLGVLVAPSTFQVLQSSDPANGRWLAGLVFGEVLRRFHWLSYICGGVLFVSLFVMKFVGPPPSAFVVRAGIVAAMLAVALYSGFVISPELERTRPQAVEATQASLVPQPDRDAGRARFDRLHRTSTTLMTVNMCLGLVLLVWYARE